MEITYELILKHLVFKNNMGITGEINNFITQKNIYNYSKNFPEKIKNLFTDKFYRYGITTYDEDKNNISFWTGLLTLLNKDFIISYDEVSHINKFKIELIESYKKSNLSSNIKDYDKNDIKERIKLEPDSEILQYIVDTLDITFMVFDFETSDVSVVYHGESLNQWKPILLFARFKTFWEPIMSVKSKGGIDRLYDINDVVIKKIFLTDGLIKYYKDIKPFVLSNIDDIIAKESTKLDNNKDDNDSVQSNDIFIDCDIEELKKSINKTKLNKMKLEELITLAKQLKINIDISTEKKSINATNKPSSKNKPITKAFLTKLIFEIIV